MKDIITVMKFTIKEMFKRKSFIISTIITLAMIIIGFNIPNIIKLFSDNEKGLNSKLLIVDNDNVFEGSLNNLNDLDIGYEIKVSNDSIDSVKEKINEKKVDKALYIVKNNDYIEVKYLVENVFLADEIPQDITGLLETLYRNLQISKLNLTVEEIKSLNPNFIMNIEQTGEEINGNIFVMMLLSLVLFYAIYFCAYQVSSSITIEKTSKIMETLVTSTSPKVIVLGKTIGIGVVGLLQMLTYVIVAVICANLFVEEALINSVLDVKSITIGLGIITFFYFILGYLAYSLLYALTGSTVSKPEDVQNANGPVAIVAVASFYLAYFTMMNPTSSLNEFASIFPFSSPFCMPLRIMMGITDIKSVIISILVLVLTIVLVAKIAIRVYSNAILNYGTKLSIKDIIKVYKQK